MGQLDDSDIGHIADLSASIVELLGALNADPRVEVRINRGGIEVFAPTNEPPRPKVYVAGPMSAFWREEYNREAFETAAKHLREFGFDPIIPHELDTESGVDLSRPPESFTRDEKAAMMRRDLAAIDKCVAVLSIGMDFYSSGRNVELAYAAFIGVPVFTSVSDVSNFFGSQDNAA